MSLSAGARLFQIKFFRSNAVFLDIECNDLLWEDYLDYHVCVKWYLKGIHFKQILKKVFSSWYIIMDVGNSTSW